MNVIKTWAVALCAACLVGAAVSFLKPEASLGKVVNFALAAFFISVLITPFIGANKVDFSSVFDNKTDVSAVESADEYIISRKLSAASEEVKRIIGEYLERKKYTFKDIEVSMNIDENGSIFINEITISGVKKEQAEKIHSYLKKELDLEVSVKDVT